MLKTFNVQEMVEKRVVPFGNGSIVYTPKTWIGKKAFVLIEEQPQDIEKAVFEALKSLLPELEGIFLFGSHARNEATENSDIDVLAISTKKMSLPKTQKFEFVVKTKDELLSGLKSDHNLFLHQALSEAKPLLNRQLLEELRKTKTMPDFSVFFNDTLSAFQNIESLLQNDKKTGQKYCTAHACIYSLVLRVRTMFLIQCFLKKQAFSGKKFFEFLGKKGFSQKTLNSFFEAYRAEKDDKKSSAKILLSDVQELFDAAKEEFLKTEKMAKK